MAGVHFPSPYMLILYNMNSNNNDKLNNSAVFPLVLAKPTALLPTSSSVHTVPQDNKIKSHNKDQLSLLCSSQFYCDPKEEESRKEASSSLDTCTIKQVEKMMTESDTPVTRGQHRKRLLETGSSSSTVDGVDQTPKSKAKGKRGRKRKSGSVNAPTCKKVGLKTCANCGTVADKVKAKKCQKCQKFFFDHWARRCRIPPCPSCHFSRKSRGSNETVPQFCERCGYALNDGDYQQANVEEVGIHVGDGDSTSDTSSFHLSEEYRDIDDLSRSRDSENEDGESLPEYSDAKTDTNDGAGKGTVEISKMAQNLPGESSLLRNVEDFRNEISTFSHAVDATTVCENNMSNNFSHSKGLDINLPTSTDVTRSDVTNSRQLDTYIAGRSDDHLPSVERHVSSETENHTSVDFVKGGGGIEQTPIEQNVLQSAVSDRNVVSFQFAENQKREWSSETSDESEKVQTYSNAVLAPDDLKTHERAAKAASFLSVSPMESEKDRMPAVKTPKSCPVSTASSLIVAAASSTSNSKTKAVTVCPSGIAVVSAFGVNPSSTLQETSETPVELSDSEPAAIAITSSGCVPPQMLKNLTVNHMHKHQLLSQQEGSQSSSSELSNQSAHPQAGGSNVQDRHQQQEKQNALINQQIILSQKCQQLINQLQTQVHKQQQLKAMMLLNQQIKELPLSSQLLQRDIAPKPDQNLMAYHGVLPPVPTEESATRCALLSTKSGHGEVMTEGITVDSSCKSVIQSSQVIPRSASLPPQLVPSSSLEPGYDSDVLLPKVSPVSTSCISHTLPPPPLKPSALSNVSGISPSIMSDPEGIVSCSSQPLPDHCDHHSLPSQNASVIENRLVTDATSTRREGGSIHDLNMTCEYLQSTKTVSGTVSSPSPASGSFRKLEVGSPSTGSGQSNKIRVSLLKPKDDSDIFPSVTDFSTNSSITATQSCVDDDPPLTAGAVAFGGKFQNFALSPNLSVIATVETQKGMQDSVAQSSHISPAEAETAKNLKLFQPKSDTLEPQKSSEDCSSGQTTIINRCTPEEIEELSSNIQKRIDSVLTDSTSLTFMSPNQTQTLRQSSRPQLPMLVGPSPRLPIPGGGAVSVTVIRSTTQSELRSGAGVYTTADKDIPRSATVMTPQTLLPLESGNSLEQSKPSLQPLVSRISSDLPSVGVQAIPSMFNKIAPRKPGPSGVVTVQVCSGARNSSTGSVTKMASESVGVGTELSASRAAGVLMTPSILRPRPSAQIGGVLVTPQPSVEHTATSYLPSTNRGLMTKSTPASASNNDSPIFPRSPSSRSVFVTKLHSPVLPHATQSAVQSYNPRSRPNLKQLSSPAFEEALMSASKSNVKHVQEEETLPKKEKKTGKGKGKDRCKMGRKRKKVYEKSGKEEKVQTKKGSTV